MAHGMPDTVTFDLSRTTLLLRGLVLLAVALFAFSIIRTQIGHFDWFFVVMLTVLCGWTLLKFLSRLRYGSEIRLVLDHEGLSAPHLFARKLPWSAIAGHRIRRINREGWFLCIDVPHAELYEPRRIDPGHSLRLALGRRRFCIDIDELKGRRSEIVAALRHFAPPLKSG